MANDWLDKLKLGDEVIVCGGFDDGYPAKVKRFTKTLIILEDDSRFRKKYGGQQGSGYHRGFLLQPSQERLDRILHRRWAVKLANYKWKNESLETLAKIVVLLTDDKA